MRSLVATIGLALALLPVAAAQQPTMSVAITGLPAEFAGLASNQTATAAFKVQVTLAGVVCPQGATIPVTITVTPSSPPPFLTFAADPAEVSVPIPAGQSVSSPASGSVDAAVVATVGEILANASVPVEVKATAAAPSGCQGAGSLSGAESTASINATVTAPPPPPPPTPEENDSPGPGALAGILTAFAVAAMRRRRA